MTECDLIPSKNGNIHQKKMYFPFLLFRVFKLALFSTKL